MGYHFNLEMVTQETDSHILTLKHGKTTHEYREAVVIEVSLKSLINAPCNAIVLLRPIQEVRKVWPGDT